MASQLLARVNSLRQPATGKTASEDEAALRHLLQVELPSQLQQYDKQLQEAAADQMQYDEASSSTADYHQAVPVADLLGLDDGWDGIPATAGEPAFGSISGAAGAQLLTDEDLAAADFAVAFQAPDLSAEYAQQKSDQQQQLDGGGQGFENLWDDAYDWDSPIDASVTAEPQGPEQAADPSSRTEWSDWAPPEGSDAADMDAFDLLFGSSADPAAGDSSSSTTPNPIAGLVAADAAEEGSMQDLEVVEPVAYIADSAPKSADSEQSMIAATASSSLPATAVVPHPAAVDDEPAAATSDAQVFNEFVASLSLKQKSELLLGPAEEPAFDSAASLPESLKHAAQQVVDILESTVSSSNSSKDLACLQLLQKLKVLWQRLSDPATRTSDPLFIFRDGPVTVAAKQGLLLCIEDFDSPSQAVTERLNSLLEPERTFAITEDITLGPGGADVELPASFQVSQKSLPSCQIHWACILHCAGLCQRVDVWIVSRLVGTCHLMACILQSCEQGQDLQSPANCKPYWLAHNIAL